MKTILSLGKTSINTISILFLLAFASRAMTHGTEEQPIDNSQQLRIWCQNKSAEYFLAQGHTPYNWTASWWNENNFLFVKGEWKVDGKAHVVQCAVRKGVAEKYATWNFINEE